MVRPTRAAVIALLIAAALLGGCGRPGGDATSPGSPSVPAATGDPCAMLAASGCLPSASDTPSPTPEPTASRARTSISGHWKGTYTCAQGLTGLDLELTENTDGTIEGIFAFGPVPSNPGVPNGSYSVTGTIADDVLTLTPKEWISHPSGYVMVGLTARLTGSDPDVIEGTVTSSGCGTFRIAR